MEKQFEDFSASCEIEKELAHHRQLLLQQAKQIQMFRWVLCACLMMGGMFGLYKVGGFSWYVNAAGIPTGTTLYYAGVIQENGIPVNGNAAVTVELYDAASAGIKRCDVTATTTFRDGNFRLALPSACVSAVRQYPNLYAQVVFKGVAIPGRNKLAAVPYAVVADNAVTAKNAEVAATLENTVLTGQLKLLASSLVGTAGGDVAAKGRIEDKTGFLVPVGAVMAFGGPKTAIPKGWLYCDGRTLKRTDYPDLFAVIGTAHGAPSSTEFNLPDYRGIFLRGVADGQTTDPDRGVRVASNLGGNAGDNVGSRQGFQLQSHNHSETRQAQGCSGGACPTFGGGGYAYLSTVNTGASGGSETRPVNVYVYYMMKY